MQALDFQIASGETLDNELPTFVMGPTDLIVALKSNLHVRKQSQKN